jgi:ribosomal protein L16 Arg81 hydroxylase
LPDALLSRSDALSRLVHPIDPDTFRHHYWERQPLIVARDDPLFYEDLLSLPDVDHILATSSVRNANLRVVKEGREMPIADLVTSWGSNATGLETLYAQYRDGWTIVLNSLHERWEPLARLCRSLADDFSAATQVNVYLTPRNAKGLTTHFDTHDVFVVQVAGS